MSFNLTDVVNATESGGSPIPTFEPSLPTCVALSALGGLLEVTSTMCLAFPEFKAKLGRPYGKLTQRALLVVNLALMGVASVLYIVGSWFGPVSISVPTVLRHGQRHRPSSSRTGHLRREAPSLCPRAEPQPAGAPHCRPGASPRLRPSRRSRCVPR